MLIYTREANSCGAIRLGSSKKPIVSCLQGKYGWQVGILVMLFLLANDIK